MVSQTLVQSTFEDGSQRDQRWIMVGAIVSTSRACLLHAAYRLQYLKSAGVASVCIS